MKIVPAFAIAALLLFPCLTASSPASAEEEAFYCEVLSVEGTAYLNNQQTYGKALQEGDLLKADDEVETGEGVTVELAFDKEWSNVTRIEEKSHMKVKAVFPTRLYLDKGALYAKLKSLPKDSTFQVETPTAIAAVRGTEYRTEYANGETSVSNDSEKDTSQVYLYEPDSAGELRGDPTVLPRAQFTGVAQGGKPRPPQPMGEQLQKQSCQKARGVLENHVREQAARGRVSKIQDVRQMEAFGRQMKEKQAGERNQQQRRMEDRRTGGNQDPPGGSQSGGPKQRDGSPLSSMEGAKRYNGQETRNTSPQAEEGQRPVNRYRYTDPGPGQDATPPVDHFPGGDIRPASINGEQRRPGTYPNQQTRPAGNREGGTRQGQQAQGRPGPRPTQRGTVR